MLFQAHQNLIFSLIFGLHSIAYSVESANLKTQENINIRLGFQGSAVQSVTLKANDSSQPELILNQKRTLELLDQKVHSNLLKLADINFEKIKTLFAEAGVSSIQATSLDDFYIVNEFHHGIKKIQKPEEIYSTNISYKDDAQFWIAVIPKSSIVSNISVQTEWFGEGIGAHGQIRFKLNTPVLLFPKTASNSGTLNLLNSNWKERLTADTSKIQIVPGDLVFTLMVNRYVGGPDVWGPQTGLTGVFGNAYGLASMDHMALVETHENVLKEISLQDPSTKGQKVFEFALKNANQLGQGHIYNLIFNSCITTAMQTLYSNGEGYNVDPYAFNPYNFTQSIQSFRKIEEPETNLNETYGSPLSKVEIMPSVQSKINIIKQPQFDSMIKSVAFQLLDFNYEELQIIIEITKQLFDKTYSISTIKNDGLPWQLEELCRTTIETYSNTNKKLSPELKQKIYQKLILLVNQIEDKKTFELMKEMYGQYLKAQI